MTSFNDGIEAAAKRLREISHEGLKASWWRERFEGAARSVEALKRPEPSEAERVEKVARALCEADGEDPDHEVRGGQSQDFENYGPRWKADVLGLTNYEKMARAALKAMEQQGKEA